MKFDQLLTRLGELPLFDIAMVSQIFQEPKESVRVQLHRWIKRGKLVHLRRSMYTFADRYRRKSLFPLRLANELYRPSYLSDLWALSFLGLIPEMVITYTSITVRSPRSFTNTFGTFDYYHIKQSLFFGFSKRKLQSEEVWFADPEKALLDYWYLHPGEWTVARLESMRFQQCELIDRQKLRHQAQKFSSPRLLRAVENLEILAGQGEES